jgi:hypothetical protein
MFGNLKDLRLEHRFYIDSSPTAYDVYLRKGKERLANHRRERRERSGNHYFAII